MSRRQNVKLIARISRAYAMNHLGLDPKTMTLTQDSAWINLAERLKAQARHSLTDQKSVSQKLATIR